MLRVRAEALSDFRAFERQALVIMARYGGRLERALVLEPDREPGVLEELHIVHFPSEAEFRSYRADPALGALAELRARSVISTEISEGEDVPDYGLLPPLGS